MAEILKAIVLGVVQGATEFIPVSSSGHLVIIPWLLGWDKSSLLFETILHWGTLLAIGFVFWRDLLDIFVATLGSIASRSLADINARIGWFIVIGSIPAVVTGLLFKDFFESLFSSPMAAGGFLLVTAALLAGSEVMSRQLTRLSALGKLNLSDSVVIGVAQAIALAPGISRSGSTIAAGLARGLRRDSAARFSFLLGTPAFLGAGLLQLTDALSADPGQVAAQVPAMIVGFVVSAITGIIAIRALLAYLRTRSLNVFAVYCATLGALVILLSVVWK